MEAVNEPSTTTASKAKSSSSYEDAAPQDVRPYDILCGRSKTCFNNIGNRRFRITISMNLKKYDTLANRGEKSKFINNLARTLKEDVGFRFVHISSKQGRVELTDEQIRAKIGHALRDLSKSQKEAAAVAARPLGTEEAQKIIESTKSPVPSKETPPPPPPSKVKIVTPELPARRVTNDFEPDTLGKLMALPNCPDIRKKAMMDASASKPPPPQLPRAIFFSPQKHSEDTMLPIAEEAPKLKIAPSLDQEHVDCKPAPVAAAAPADGAHYQEDEYCLMPLRFDPEPEPHDVLDPIPLDVIDIKMPPKAARSYSLPTNIGFKDHPFLTTTMDEDLSVCTVPYNDEVPRQHSTPRYEEGPLYHHPRKTRASFPSMHHHHHHQHHQQSQHPDLMSMGSNDDHMVSLCDSVDCLSLDMDAGVHVA